ncbi:MAG: hypothetical protein GY909_15400 [Oligoflexia bacterium]|nr:hypothetical protein [Oligoflexia bacterium]
MNFDIARDQVYSLMTNTLVDGIVSSILDNPILSYESGGFLRYIFTIAFGYQVFLIWKNSNTPGDMVVRGAKTVLATAFFFTLIGYGHFEVRKASGYFGLDLYSESGMQDYEYGSKKKMLHRDVFNYLRFKSKQIGKKAFKIESDQNKQEQIELQNKNETILKGYKFCHSLPKNRVNECYEDLQIKTCSQKPTPKCLDFVNFQVKKLEEKEACSGGITGVSCQIDKMRQSFVNFFSFESIAYAILKIVSFIVMLISILMYAAIALIIAFSMLFFTLTCPLVVVEDLRGKVFSSLKFLLSLSLVDFVIYLAEFVSHTFFASANDAIGVALAKAWSYNSLTANALVFPIMIQGVGYAVIGGVVQIALLMNVIKFSQALFNLELEKLTDITGDIMNSLRTVGTLVGTVYTAGTAALASGIDKYISSAENFSNNLRGGRPNLPGGGNPGGGGGTPGGNNRSNFSNSNYEESASSGEYRSGVGAGPMLNGEPGSYADQINQSLNQDSVRRKDINRLTRAFEENNAPARIPGLSEKLKKQTLEKEKSTLKEKEVERKTLTPEMLSMSGPKALGPSRSLNKAPKHKPVVKNEDEAPKRNVRLMEGIRNKMGRAKSSVLEGVEKMRDLGDGSIVKGIGKGALIKGLDASIGGANMAKKVGRVADGALRTSGNLANMSTAMTTNTDSVTGASEVFQKAGNVKNTLVGEMEAFKNYHVADEGLANQYLEMNDDDSTEKSTFNFTSRESMQKEIDSIENSENPYAEELASLKSVDSESLTPDEQAERDIKLRELGKLNKFFESEIKAKAEKKKNDFEKIRSTDEWQTINDLYEKLDKESLDDHDKQFFEREGREKVKDLLMNNKLDEATYKEIKKKMKSHNETRWVLNSILKKKRDLKKKTLEGNLTKGNLSELNKALKRGEISKEHFKNIIDKAEYGKK